eukprot:gb/GECG01009993.1/.p1 GENE.gb/GECG01009993.1/~~gb/GECG01009993.1/.p1  ORF type:complete len:264 (+),score=25.57 gb/GECG01009993.1/:1-792(+)
MPNLGTCKHMMCPIRSCGTWEVAQEKDQSITVIKYPSRRNFYRVCIPCPWYILIAPCVHSVDEFEIAADGTVECRQRYLCETQRSEIHDIYQLECLAVDMEEIDKSKKNYCLRFRTQDEELLPDPMEMLEMNGPNRLEMSLNRENISQRKYIAERVNEFLGKKGTYSEYNPRAVGNNDSIEPPNSAESKSSSSSATTESVQSMNNPLWQTPAHHAPAAPTGATGVANHWRQSMPPSIHQPETRKQQLSEPRSMRDILQDRLRT